uniref:Uncharacterized protein n=1 Tax=Spongospora subterranea TaxID=70186 RepID=A0A0H5QJ21_9EUKA|eukprot:CRZ02105.1 hypothetical protein [Spongospora subterranea]
MVELIVDGHDIGEFRSWLRASDFIVLNGIFSGHGGPPGNSGMETPVAALCRLANVASRYQLLQLGICIVNRRDDDSLCVRPFTIDVFPADFKLSDRMLLTKSLFECDADHMKALSDSNFDFNRVFSNGMNWLSPLDEAAINENLKRKRTVKEASIDDKRSIKPNTQHDALFVKSVDTALRSYSVSSSASAAVNAGRSALNSIAVPDTLVTFSISPDGFFLINPGNAFLRRLLYQSIEAFPLLKSRKYATEDNRRPAVAILQCPQSNDPDLDPQQVLRRRLLQELDDVDSANATAIDFQVGLRYVVEEIVAAQKPIFGERLLEILLHFELILTGRLPDTFNDLKDNLSCRWSSVSCHDLSRDSIRAAALVYEPQFEKYSRPLATLEAGATALDLIRKIDLSRCYKDSVLCIPGSFALIDLNGGRDGFSEDVISVLVVEADLDQCTISGLNSLEILHRDTKAAMFRASDERQARAWVSRMIQDGRSAFMLVDRMQANKNAIISLTGPYKRPRESD